MPDNTANTKNGEQYGNASSTMPSSNLGGIVFYGNETSPSVTIDVKTANYFLHSVSIHLENIQIK